MRLNTAVPNPRVPSLEEQGLGWKNTFGSGKGADTITSGLEGAWTTNPVKWDNGYFENLFGYEWELTKGPGGANQWTPKDAKAQGTVPDAHDPSKKHAPMMFTTDLSLKMDPIYAPIAKRFHKNPDELRRSLCQGVVQADAPRHGARLALARPAGSPEPQLWQDPVPAVDHELIGEQDIAQLKAKILASGLSISQLVTTAWASASTFRGTDKRGGANGARIRLAPQKDWEVNQPAELAKVLQTLEKIQKDFNSCAVRREEGLARGRDRPGWVRRRRGRCEEGRARRAGSLLAGAHRRVAGDDRRGVLCRARTDRGRVPQLSPQGTSIDRRRSCWWIGRTC